MSDAHEQSDQSTHTPHGAAAPAPPMLARFLDGVSEPSDLKHRLEVYVAAVGEDMAFHPIDDLVVTMEGFFPAVMKAHAKAIAMASALATGLQARAHAGRSIATSAGAALNIATAADYGTDIYKASVELDTRAKAASESLLLLSREGLDLSLALASVPVPALAQALHVASANFTAGVDVASFSERHEDLVTRLSRGLRRGRTKPLSDAAEAAFDAMTALSREANRFSDQLTRRKAVNSLISEELISEAQSVRDACAAELAGPLVDALAETYRLVAQRELMLSRVKVYEDLSDCLSKEVKRRATP